MNKFIDVFGYRISADGVEKDVDKAVNSIKKLSPPSWMACANPHSLVEARTDRDFDAALHDADILLPDGSGIILASRILGAPVHERVAGFDFFNELTSRSTDSELKYFFLGSSEKVLSLISKRIADECPGITVTGTYSPPFKDEFTKSDNQLMIDTVNAAQPDVLWVGMTAPKQEKWIFRNREKLNVPFVGAIGAVFDFYAGTKYRAPDWICAMGLEWLPRFLKEPRRLWRRNLVSTPVFVFRVFLQKFTGKNHGR